MMFSFNLQVIAELNALLEKVKSQHAQTERKSKEEIDSLKPKEDSLKVDVMNLCPLIWTVLSTCP